MIGDMSGFAYWQAIVSIHIIMKYIKMGYLILYKIGMIFVLLDEIKRHLVKMIQQMFIQIHVSFHVVLGMHVQNDLPKSV
jgi:hypothetical protein